YEIEYQKIIRDANRIQRKRFFIQTLLVFLSAASLLLASGGMTACVSVGIIYDIIGLAIAGGIICPLIGFPGLVLGIYFYVDLRDRLYNQFKEYMEKQNYEISIK